MLSLQIYSSDEWNDQKRFPNGAVQWIRTLKTRIRSFYVPMTVFVQCYIDLMETTDCCSQLHVN